jgi:alpha-glucosidase
VQVADPASVFAHCRRFLAFRRTQRALVDGAMALLPAHDDVVAWTRGQGDDQVLCVFNLSPRPARYALDGVEADALDGHGFAGAIELSADGAARECVLPPNGAFFGRVRAHPQPTRSLP